MNMVRGSWRSGADRKRIRGTGRPGKTMKIDDSFGCVSSEEEMRGVRVLAFLGWEKLGAVVCSLRRWGSEASSFVCSCYV
jgi:hypothetical protein